MNRRLVCTLLVTALYYLGNVRGMKTLQRTPHDEIFHGMMLSEMAYYAVFGIALILFVPWKSAAMPGLGVLKWCASFLACMAVSFCLGFPSLHRVYGFDQAAGGLLGDTADIAAEYTGKSIGTTGHQRRFSMHQNRHARRQRGLDYTTLYSRVNRKSEEISICTTHEIA